MRLIYFAETNDHAIPTLVNANLLTLQALYYEPVCSLMYDVNKNTAPDNILKLFSRISSVHNTIHVPQRLNIFILKNLDSMSNEMLFYVLG